MAGQSRAGLHTQHFSCRWFGELNRLQTAVVGLGEVSPGLPADCLSQLRLSTVVARCRRDARRVKPSRGSRDAAAGGKCT